MKNTDTNRDGKIDREEYRAMLGSLRDRSRSLGDRFAEIDKNGDGKISKDEFEGPAPVFARIDTDSDGSISKDEAAKFQPGRNANAGAAGANAERFGLRLREMDANQDGKVSKEEFKGEPAQFDRLDVNKDGVLSREDNPDAARGDGVPPGGRPGAGSGERFRAMDKNGDGKLSRDEFTGPAAFFDRADADKDGVITLQELSRMGPPGGPGGAGRGGMAERLRAMDKNEDGKISKDEFTGPAPIFERLDANSDGFITPDEMRPNRPEPGKTEGARRGPEEKKG